MKTGNWVIFKNENWNVYNLLKNGNIVLHPESDQGVSSGSLIEVSSSELKELTVCH